VAGGAFLLCRPAPSTGEDEATGRAQGHDVLGPQGWRGSADVSSGGRTTARYEEGGREGKSHGVDKADSVPCFVTSGDLTR